jgi:hypothetical protein
MSKATIARITGTGTSRIGDMRRRLEVITRADKQPTGSWYRDRQDDMPGSMAQELTPAEVKAAIRSHAQAHRKIMAPAPRLSPAQSVEAFAQAMGHRAFRLAVEAYYGGPDEFAQLFDEPVEEPCEPREERPLDDY